MSEDATKALGSAVQSKDAKAAKAAVAAGADVNGKTGVGTPYLCAAIEKKSKTLVKLLLGADADVQATDRQGQAAVHYLAEHLRDTKILAVVAEKGADLDARDEVKFKGWTALHHAVRFKKRDFAEALVEHGAELDVKCTEKQETPLMLLLRSDSGVMNATEEANALWLIEAGADVNTVNELNAGTLHMAAQSGSRKLLDALLAAGARPTTNKYGSTPLHYCVSTNDKDTALWDRLIGLGCGLEDRARGETVIMRAQMSWNATAVAYFIEKGADLAAKDDEGKTVLERAQELNQTKIIALLEKALKKAKG